MTKSIPPPELLRQLLRYEPDTGKLFWRERPVGLFSDGYRTAEHTCRWWHSRFAGKPALSTANTNGYQHGDIFGKKYRAHRVIWAMATGEWPVAEIDHINHIRSDNRIGNLREATRQENARNQSMRSDNTSGVIGVHWRKRDRKWLAQIRVGGVAKHLGYFTDKTDAIAARAAADVKYSFHHNHGCSMAGTQTPR